VQRFAFKQITCGIDFTFAITRVQGEITKANTLWSWGNSRFIQRRTGKKQEDIIANCKKPEKVEIHSPNRIVEINAYYSMVWAFYDDNSVYKWGHFLKDTPENQENLDFEKAHKMFTSEKDFKV